MRIAHVRDRNAPAGTPWRLAAARDGGAQPLRWLDLEEARQGLVVEDPRRAHNSALFRHAITTLDDHLARGLRVADLAELVDGYARADDDEAILDAPDLAFGPPIVHPPSLRDFYAFEGHVKTMWERRGGEVPEAWYRLPTWASPTQKRRSAGTRSSTTGAPAICSARRRPCALDRPRARTSRPPSV